MSIYSDVSAFLTPANWGKLEMEENGKYCVLGAYGSILGYENMNDLYESNEFTAKLAKIIREQYSDRLLSNPDAETYGVVYEFNDHSKTTLDDIRLVLEKADADE